MPAHTTHFTAPVPEKLFTKVNLVFIALLLLATIAAMYPSLSAGFISWDDPANLLENDQLKELLSWASLGDIFGSGVNGRYTPLPILTFALEKYFFAPVPTQSPFIFHFTNLLLHLGCTVLVFILFLKLGANAAGAFLGALLFGIHPMHVESVAWVSGRKDVLYGLTYIGALICYINFTRGTDKSNKWFAAALALSVLSYFSNVLAISLPLSMVAIDIYLKRKWITPELLVSEKLPWWIFSFLFGVGGLLMLKRADAFTLAAPLSDYNYTFVDHMAVGAYTYGSYLARWIYPFDLTLYHPFPAHLPAVAYALLVVIPLAIAVILYWAIKKKQSYVLFGWLFFTVNIMMLLQIVPVGTSLISERYTYIAYIGLFFVLAKAYETLVIRFPRWSKPVAGMLAVYCALLVNIAYTQAATWKNTTSICGHNIECYPASFYGYNQLGIMYLRQSFDPGISDDKKLQLIRNAQSNFLSAYNADSAAGSMSPTITSDIAQNAGIIYGLLSEKESAIHFFSRALSLTPENIETIKNRAYQYFLNKDFVLAIADYTKAIQLEPGNENLYYLRANSSYASGDLTNSMADLNKAISLGSKDPNCFIARSVIHRANGNVDAAHEDARRAKNLGADVPDIYFQ